MTAEELALSLAGCSIRYATRALLESSSSLWCGCGTSDKLNSLATTQAQNQVFDLVLPNIYPSYELLERGPGLQNQSCRMSITKNSNMISERSSGEGLVLFVYQKL